MGVEKKHVGERQTKIKWMRGEDKNKNEWSCTEKGWGKKSNSEGISGAERFGLEALDVRLQLSEPLLMCSVTFHQHFSYTVEQNKPNKTLIVLH